MCGSHGWTTDQSKVELGCTARGPSFGQDSNGYAASYEDQDDLEDVGDGLAFLHIARVQLHVGVAPTGLLPGRSRGGLAEGARGRGGVWSDEVEGQVEAKQTTMGQDAEGGGKRVYTNESGRGGAL